MIPQCEERWKVRLAADRDFRPLRAATNVWPGRMSGNISAKRIIGSGSAPQGFMMLDLRAHLSGHSVTRIGKITLPRQPRDSSPYTATGSEIWTMNPWESCSPAHRHPGGSAVARSSRSQRVERQTRSPGRRKIAFPLWR